jgi:hypothetical protein
MSKTAPSPPSPSNSGPKAIETLVARDKEPKFGADAVAAMRDATGPHRLIESLNGSTVYGDRKERATVPIASSLPVAWGQRRGS